MYKPLFAITAQDGSTALHLGCQGGDLEVAETLITANYASVNAQTKVSAHEFMLVFAMRVACASLHLIQFINMTPLMYAAMNGLGSIVELLLSKGADPNLKNSVSLIYRSMSDIYCTLQMRVHSLIQVGKTAGDLAQEFGHKQVYQRLSLS